MFILDIIPIQKGIPFDTLSYFSGSDLSIGTVVSVKIGNTPRFGLVLMCRPLAEERSSLRNANFTLKKIDRVVFENNNVAALVSALTTVREKTLAPLGTIASTLISAKFLEHWLKNIEKESPVFLVKEFLKDKEQITSSTEFCIGTTKVRERSYRERTRSSFALGKSIVIVVPTIIDAEKIYADISKGIEKRTVCLHSKKKQTDITKSLAILESKDPVVIITTVSFAFVPRNDIGTIIIEKESSDFFLSNDRFHIDTRLFVVAWAKAIGATLVIGDIVPRFENFSMHDRARYPEIPAQNIQTVIPTMQKNAILPDEAMQLIRYALKQNTSIFIYSHRRGLAPVSRCKDCGTVVSCPECALPLALKTVLDRDKNEQRVFVCNHCGYTTSADHSCTNCHGWNIVATNIGTESIVEDIKNNIDNHAPIVLLEDIQHKLTDKTAVKDTSKTQQKDEEKTACIYVGTEHMLPYIPDVEYSVMPFFDRLMSTPSYETIEKALRSVLTMSEHTTRTALVCTSQKPEDTTFFMHIERGTIEHLIEEELTLRKQFHFPPFGIFLKATITMPIGIAARTIEYGNAVFADMGLSPISLTPRRVSGATNAVSKSWIVVVSKDWLKTTGSDMVQKLLAITPQVAIERNPHYFS